MRRAFLTLLIGLASFGHAQFGMGSAGRMMTRPAFLVQQGEVRKELKTTKEQNKLFDAMVRQQGNPTSLSEIQKQFDDNDKAVADALDEAQRLRLKQIRWQILKGVALAEPDLAKALELTEAQNGRVKEIRKAAERAATDLMAQSEARKMADNMKKLIADTSAQLLALLTPAQAEAMKGLLGKPFKLPKMLESQLII